MNKWTTSAPVPTASQQTPATARTFDAWMLAAILLATLALRYQDITQPLDDMFSWREASTAMMADNFQARSWNIFYPEVSWTGPGQSYQGREFQIISYIAAILQSLFGWHDWIGRAVAAAFGVWSVYAMHRLTEQLWGRTHAHAAALMLAIMPGAVAIDSSFLPDPAMLALTLTGFWMLIVYLKEGHARHIVACVGLTALGIMAKLSGIAVLFPMGYVALAIPYSRGTLTPGKLAMLLTAGLAVLGMVFGYYGWAVYLGTTYPPYHIAGSGYIWDDGIATLAGRGFYLAAAWRSAEAWLLTVPVLVLAVLGLLAGPPAGEEEYVRPERWAFHVWLAGVAVLYIAAAREITANPWNFLILLPAAAAFAGRGLLSIWTLGRVGGGRIWPAARVGAVLAAILAFGTLPGVETVRTPYAAKSRALGERLAELSQPGDLVITVARQVGDPIAIYYSRRRGFVFPPGGGARDWSSFADREEQAIAELEDLRRQGAAWFGAVRRARDTRQRSFEIHHAPLIAYLDRTAERAVDDNDLLIYRLKSNPAQE